MTNDSSLLRALLVLYAVPGSLFALMIALFTYHGSRGRLLANWPADVAVGLLAVSALFLALVARRRWPAAATVSSRQSGASSGAMHGRDAAETSALARLKTPAVGLIITGILYWITVVVLYVIRFVGPIEIEPFVKMPPISDRVFEFLWIRLGILPAFAGFVLLFAGWKMRHGEFYWFCVLGTCLPFVLMLEKLVTLREQRFAMALGDWTALPFGMWALIVLSRRDVREAFARGRAAPGPSDRQLSTGAALTARRRPLWPMVLLGAFCLAGILLFVPVGEEFNHVDGSVTSMPSFSWETLLMVFCVAALYGFALLWWVRGARAERSAAEAACPPGPAEPNGPAGLAETLLRLAGGVLWAGMLFCYIFAVLAALAGLFGLGAPTSFLVAAGMCAATAAAAVIVGRRWGGWCSRAGAIWLNAGCVLVAVAAGFGAAWHFSAPRGSEPSPPPNAVGAGTGELTVVHSKAIKLFVERLAPNRAVMRDTDSTPGETTHRVPAGKYKIQATWPGAARPFFATTVHLIAGETLRVEVPAVALDDSKLDDLRRLVDLKKQAVELAENRFRVGILSPNDVTLAEIDLLEAQIRLAEAEQKLAAVTQFGKELVQRHEQRLEWTKKLFEAGRVTAAELNKVEQELLQAKARFPGAAAPPSKKAAPPPGKKDSARAIRFDPRKTWRSRATGSALAETSRFGERCCPPHPAWQVRREVGWRPLLNDLLTAPGAAG